MTNGFFPLAFIAIVPFQERLVFGRKTAGYRQAVPVNGISTISQADAYSIDV
jgi:hypothetical protein